jgi:hypothetical protein
VPPRAQATSFILAIAYFVTLPSLYSNFATDEASIILGIEAAALLVVILGMLVDNAFVYPDDLLAKGKGPRWCVCRSVGCIGSSHAIWHFLSCLAAVKAAAAREYALSLQR